jgi:hypothetical protein
MKQRDMQKSVLDLGSKKVSSDHPRHHMRRMLIFSGSNSNKVIGISVRKESKRLDLILDHVLAVLVRGCPYEFDPTPSIFICDP